MCKWHMHIVCYLWGGVHMSACIMCGWPMSVVYYLWVVRVGYTCMGVCVCVELDASTQKQRHISMKE